MWRVSQCSWCKPRGQIGPPLRRRSPTVEFVVRPCAEPLQSWVSSLGDEPVVQRNSFWTASGTELVSGAHKSQGPRICACVQSTRMALILMGD